jgi:hypothetical protein
MLASCWDSGRSSKRPKKCACHEHLLDAFGLEPLVAIIQEYVHCMNISHPYFDIIRPSFCADVMSSRGFCRRGTQFRYKIGNSAEPRTVVNMCDMRSNKNVMVNFSARIFVRGQTLASFSVMLPIDSHCFEFLWDFDVDAQELLQVGIRNDMQIPDDAMLTFLKACELMRDEIWEILYEIQHECPKPSSSW